MAAQLATQNRSRIQFGEAEEPDHFRLSDSFLAGYRDRKPHFGFNGLGEFVFYRTYSRTLPDGRKETFVDTLKRVVEGCYEIQRRHCNKIHVPWDYGKAQASAQEMFRLMWDFKFLPPGRGLWMMGTEFMWTRGSAALNNCFRGDTEIITRDGIRPIGPLAGTTQTLLTENGKWVDAPIKSFGQQEIWKLTLERSGVEKVIYTTADHRWIARDRRYMDAEANPEGAHLLEWAEAAVAGHTGTKVRQRVSRWANFATRELRPNHCLRYVFGQGIKGNVRPSPFGVAHGICFGDGTWHDQESCSTYLYLCGEKNRELLRYFPNCSTSPDDSKGVDGAVRVADLPRFFRRTPSLRESKSYLYGWLAGYFAANGKINRKGNSPKLSSSKRENLEAARDVCAVLGIGTYAITGSWHKVRHQDGRVTRHYGYDMVLMSSHLGSEFFLLEEHRRRFESWSSHRDRPIYHWKVKSVEPTGETAEVFCPQVPETHSFALADNILTGNCGFVSTIDIGEDPAEPFCFLMDMSMLGVGVGFDTKGAGKLTIKAPGTETRVHVIADSREGWVDAIRQLILSYTLKSGTYHLEFDPSQVRVAGSPIRGFGGLASGPGILLSLLESVRKLLDSRVGRTLSGVDITDLMNLIGKCIVAGNVRRTAEIAFGEHDDHEYFEMKNPQRTLLPEDMDIWHAVTGELYRRAADANVTPQTDPSHFTAWQVKRWYSQHSSNAQLKGTQSQFHLNGSLDRIFSLEDDTLTIPLDRLQPAIETWNQLNNHRWASNNSIFAKVGMDYSRVAQSIAVNGEPGLIWLNNIQDYGRMADGLQPGIDGGAMGSNPCVEQSLESYELCCLVETFPANHESAEDYMRTLKFAYLYAKTTTLLPTHNPRTNSVMQRNRRIGLSQSGIVQAFYKFGRRKVLNDFCDRGYKEIRRWDDIYSRWLCVTKSIKVTSVKPSGTVSLIVGATPGIHYPEARTYWRRVRIAKNSTLLKVLQNAGYHIEPDIKEPDRTMVVKFAVDDPRVPSVDQVSMWEQMSNAAAYQSYWADNQVSCTIKFKPEDAGQIKNVLEVFEDRLKGISFLPWYGHGYAQAPYEPCTSQEVQDYNANIKELDFTEFVLEDAVGSAGCDGDSCSLL